MKARDEQARQKFSMLFGIGFDGKDGHYRRTSGKNFLLIGGSEETHEKMQDKAIALNEELDRRGRRLEDVDSAEEMRDIANDAGL
jgi:hypothetical protein